MSKGEGFKWKLWLPGQIFKKKCFWMIGGERLSVKSKVKFKKRKLNSEDSSMKLSVVIKS